MCRPRDSRWSSSTSLAFDGREILLASFSRRMAHMVDDVMATVSSAEAIHPVRGPEPPRSIEGPVQDLVERGDRRGAIEALMRSYGTDVFTAAARIVRDRAMAEDVLQQTFLEAHRDLDTFRGNSSFRSWLVSIAIHRSLDAVRRVRRDTVRTVADDPIEHIVDTKAGPDVGIDRRRRLDALEDCLRDLVPRVRAAVLMRFKNGMAYED